MITDPHVKQWNKNAINYLTQAANQGNSNALMMLYNFYEDGKIVEQNNVLVLTYLIAATQINNNQSSATPLINKLEQKLTSNQINEANLAAKQLIKNSNNIKVKF